MIYKLIVSFIAVFVDVMTCVIQVCDKNCSNTIQCNYVEFKIKYMYTVAGTEHFTGTSN